MQWLQDQKEFLSTLPARGATNNVITVDVTAEFLSTLPARGATDLRANHPLLNAVFLSTLPARGATAVSCSALWGE